MNFCRKHAILSGLVAVIILTILFVLGESTFKETVTTTFVSIPPQINIAAVSDFNSNLILHYTFDDGTATDASGKGNTGTVNGPTPTSGKVGGGALQFDGVDDQVSGASLFSSAPTALTVSAWANWSTGGGNSRVIAGKYNGSTGGFFVGSYNPSTPQCRIDTTEVKGGHLSIVSNQWYFLVCTWDGSTLSLYVDGSFVSSKPVSTMTVPSNSFAVGRYVNNSFFPGMIDDVRVYDKALSTSEISALYALGSGGSQPPPGSPPPVSEPPPTPPPDTQAPSTPTNLVSSSITTTGATLSWSASTDNVAVTSYKLYRNATQITSTSNTMYTDSSLTANTTYTYTVAASDAANNLSPQSSSLAVTTLDAPPPPVVTGNTITATSCSREHVQAAFDLAQTGDTVQIPEGTCIWTTTFNFNKPVTLKGAGIDKTVLINGVSHDKISSCDCTRAQIMTMVSSPAGLTRLTGLTIDGGTGSIDTQNNGFLKISGSSKNWKIDHARFRITRTSAIHVWAPGGVIDHNKFDIVGWYMAIYGYNGGGSNGDLAWTQSTNLGTDDALYIEDNTFYSATPSLGLDGWVGQRVVIRFNTFTNSRAGNHGTESSSRQRGARSYEIYNNTFHKTNSDAYSDGIGVRGGVGVIFNNTLTGSFTMVGSMHNYRDPHPYSPWGQCDGTSPFDLNDVEADGVTTKVYDTGTAAAGATSINQNITLTTDKLWSPNQWIGYSIWNTRTNIKSPIVSNTSNTIVGYTDNTNSKTPLAWTAGDPFKIVRATVCLDQVGRGKGNMISGSTPSPQAWPQQELDPTYIWNNTLKGSVTGIGDTSVHIVENRDYYNNMCKPGYTPYTYPHPLVQQQDGVSTQPVPLNCPGVTPIAGSCGTSLNMCTAGTFSDVADTTTEHKWSCLGVNGGTTASCSLTKSGTTPKPGDFNKDGSVNALDFSILSTYWNQNNAAYDLNADNIINSLDYVILVRNWTG